jgi:hypothetical protein
MFARKCAFGAEIATMHKLNLKPQGLEILQYQLAKRYVVVNDVGQAFLPVAV